MRSKDTTLEVLPVDAAAVIPQAESTRIATIVALSADGVVKVQVGRDGPVVPARLAFRATRERIHVAIARSQQAVVLFENGDPSKPIVMGLVEPLEPSRIEMPFVDADVDGKRVQVTAQDEIVLKCGEASITLRRNGRVIIRGTYVETHSQGTNRIKGGQVQIN